MLQDLPISFIRHLLETNPNATSFNLSDGKTFGPTVPRSVLANELVNRAEPATVASVTRTHGLHSIQGYNNQD